MEEERVFVKKNAARGLALLLVWMMVWGMAASAQATVVTSAYGNTEEDPTQAVESAAVLEGAAYLLTTSGAIGRFDPATRETAPVGSCLMAKYISDPQALALAVGKAEDTQIPVSWLFSDGEKLYGLYTATGEWYTLLDEGGPYAPVKMDSILDAKSLLQEM